MQEESIIYYNNLIKFQGDSCLYKGIVYTKQGKREIIYDHREYDGISALINTLKTHGLYYPGIHSGLKARLKPSFWIILKAFFRFKWSMPYRPKKWKIFLADKQNIFEKQICDELFLSAVDTKRIMENCQKHSVTFNAWMLYHLKELIKEYTFSKGICNKTIFMLPINLRDIVEIDSQEVGISKENKAGNEVSFIDILMGDQDSLVSINDQIKRKFKQQMQWGSWFAVKLTKIIPPFLQYFFIKDYIKSSRRTGLFSSVGMWDRKEKLEPHHVGAIPVNFSHMPFALSVINWQNRLYLGLSLNVKLNPSQELAKKILENYRHKIIEYKI